MSLSIQVARKLRDVHRLENPSPFHGVRAHGPPNPWWGVPSLSVPRSEMEELSVDHRQSGLSFRALRPAPRSVVTQRGGNLAQLLNPPRPLPLRPLCRCARGWTCGQSILKDTQYPAPPSFSFCALFTKVAASGVLVPAEGTSHLLEPGPLRPLFPELDCCGYACKLYGEWETVGHCQRENRKRLNLTEHGEACGHDSGVRFLRSH